MPPPLDLRLLRNQTKLPKVKMERELLRRLTKHLSPLKLRSSAKRPKPKLWLVKLLRQRRIRSDLRSTQLKRS